RATSRRSTCPAARSRGSRSCRRSSTTSRTSSSAGSPAPTSCGTGSSATSSTPTPAGTPPSPVTGSAGRARADPGRRAARARREAVRRPDEHRRHQRVRLPAGRGRVQRARDLRARRDARAPAGRAGDPVRHDRRHGRPARALDGRGGPDRRPLVPDGRAAARRRGDPERGGHPRLGRRVPRGGGRAGARRGPLARGGDAPPHHARHPAPARLRPRRARGGEGDVRAAATPPAHPPRPPMSGALLAATTGPAEGVPVSPLLLLALASLSLGAMLSAGEEAVRSITRTAAHEAEAEGRRGARAAVALAESPRPAAQATTFLRVLAEMAGAVCLTLVLVGLLDTWWQVLVGSILLSALIMLVVVGASPRRVGRRDPVGVLAVVGPTMVVLGRLAQPVARLAARLGERAGRTAEEQRAVEEEALRHMVDRVSESEQIDDDER